jgi:hypothetical protein
MYYITINAFIEDGKTSELLLDLVRTVHVLISEMLYFEKIWVWPDCRSYYGSKFCEPAALMLCSLSCLLTVVRLEGSFGHAIGRMSSSGTHYCVTRPKSTQLHYGGPHLPNKSRVTASKVLD